MVSTSHASDTRAETCYRNVPEWLRTQILNDRNAALRWIAEHQQEYEDLANATVQRARNGQTTNKYHALDAVRRSLGRTTTGYIDMNLKQAQDEADRQVARGLIILTRELHEELQPWVSPKF